MTDINNAKLADFMNRLEHHIEYLCKNLDNVANTDATKLYKVGLTIGSINQIIEQERIAANTSEEL